MLTLQMQFFQNKQCHMALLNIQITVFPQHLSSHIQSSQGATEVRCMEKGVTPRPNSVLKK